MCERGKSAGRSLGRRIKAGLFEDLHTVDGATLIPSVVSLPVAPAGVLSNQAQNVGADGVDCGWAAPGPLRPADTSVTLPRQIAVPVRDGDLVAQGESLDALVPSADGRQP
ncbi:hypothetical protein GCM10020220_083520 [Nonomuraea rubra]